VITASLGTDADRATASTSENAVDGRRSVDGDHVHRRAVDDRSDRRAVG
jgi:hypothetical protein